MKLNKKSIFQNFISLALELRTVKQRHPYFHPSRNTSSPFPTADELPGSVVQTKSRTTILWHAEHWPDEILTYVFMYGGPSISFLWCEPLKNDVTIFDPFWPENVFSSFSYTGGLLVCENEKLNCFDIQCVVKASSFRLNYHMTLESKENYPQHTKTVQNSLGFIPLPEVKPLHTPRGDLVLCALNSFPGVFHLFSLHPGPRYKDSTRGAGGGEVTWSWTSSS